MHAVGSLVHISRDSKGIGPLVVAAHDGPYHNLNNLDGTLHTSGWYTDSLTKYTPDLDFFRPGDVVKVDGKGEGIVVSVHRLIYSGYVRVAVEGKDILSPERPWTDGWRMEHVTFISRGAKVPEQHIFKVGDKVRFLSGPHEGTEATVNTVREQGRMLWVTRPTGELSGGWFPTRFQLVAPKASVQEDKVVAVTNTSSASAQTYIEAVSGVKKLLAVGIKDVTIRPRTWDDKGLYAAVVVKVAGVETSLYTPEKVDVFIKQRAPKDIVGRANIFDANRYTFEVGTGAYKRYIPAPSDGSFWTKDEVLAAKGLVTFEGQLYRLGLMAFTPFVP